MSSRFARSIGVAVLGLGVAVAVFGRSLQRAVSLEPVEPDAVARPTLDEPGTAEPGHGVSESALRLAVENDPFSETRAPSSERYRLPGERVQRPAPVREAPLTPPPPFTLLGVLTLDDGGYAVVETEDGTRAVVSLGDNVLGYRLTRLEGTTATVTLNDQTFPLIVPGPAMHPEPERRSRRGEDDRVNEARRLQIEATRMIRMQDGRTITCEDGRCVVRAGG